MNGQRFTSEYQEHQCKQEAEDGAGHQSRREAKNATKENKWMSNAPNIHGKHHMLLFKSVYLSSLVVLGGGCGVVGLIL